MKKTIVFFLGGVFAFLLFGCDQVSTQSYSSVILAGYNAASDTYRAGLASQRIFGITPQMYLSGDELFQACVDESELVSRLGYVGKEN